MKISKEQIDALNAVITLEIDKADYQGKVEEALNNYRKNASVPGFRKGLKNNMKRPYRWMSLTNSSVSL